MPTNHHCPRAAVCQHKHTLIHALTHTHTHTSKPTSTLALYFPRFSLVFGGFEGEETERNTPRWHLDRNRIPATLALVLSGKRSQTAFKSPALCPPRKSLRPPPSNSLFPQRKFTGSSHTAMDSFLVELCCHDAVARQGFQSLIAVFMFVLEDLQTTVFCFIFS